MHVLLVITQHIFDGDRVNTEDRLYLIYLSVELIIVRGLVDFLFLVVPCRS